MMTPFSPCLAEDEPLQILEDYWRTTTSPTNEYLMVLGAVTAVSILILIWVLYFRKKHRPHPHSHHHHAHQDAAEPAMQGAGEADQPRKRHKWRRRRREHRPRNPTLAETGGLPPVRNSHSSGPVP